MKKPLEIVEGMIRMSSLILLNANQCNNLLANLQKGVETIQKIIKGSKRHVFCQVERDLVRIVNEAKNVLDECCMEDWCHGAVLQINNKETFRELLLDLECCFQTICDISQICYEDQVQSILLTRKCTTFYPSSIDDVEEDYNSLYKRLLDHLESHTIKDRALAQYLLGRVASLQLVEGEELDKIVFPHDYPCSKISERLVMPLGGTGRGCVVLPTEWVDIECVTKVIKVADGEYKEALWKEANILGGLHHPNIIKFFCCGFDGATKKFELVMERGKLDLCELLVEKRSALTEAIRIDIMLQIASGMCYLHDMKVAHRDLKPNNVVVTSMDVSKLDGCLEYVHVKLIDFGDSKIKAKESPQAPTGGAGTDRQVYGTNCYMAPEAFEKRKLEVNAFKTDVFSFAMMSAEILSGEKPFNVDLCRDYVKLICDGKRPKLPENCSKELKSLLSDCWSLDPSKRPTFLHICNTLRLLKSGMFKNAISMDETLQHEEPYNLLINPKQLWIKFKGIIYNAFAKIVLLCQVFVIFTQWLRCMPKIGENGNPPQDTRNNNPSSHQILDKVNKIVNGSKRLIGMKYQICEFERHLQKNGSLGIVGMGGIGKSTLANALSVRISHCFDGTCFVSNITGGTCTFLFKYKLEDSQESPQVKTLIEGREMIKHICKTRKILIVLDNVSEQSDLDQLLGDHLFKDVNGSKLIASSRDRKSFGPYIPEANIINMKTLEGGQPMELFSMHAFQNDQACAPYLKHVAEKIVNACGGLPLSLEVMGKCMNGEGRLRIWERTLHRLLKARHDGSEDEQIWKTLRISFDGLGDEEKSMFIDISCFFNLDQYFRGLKFSQEDIIGMSTLDANIAQKTLESLNSKSLVKVDGNGLLEIHDQLRDMGRMLADLEFKGTRLRNLCLATFINHCKQKCMQHVQGMSFERLECKSTYDGSFEMVDMPHLRLLSIQNCNDVDVLFDILKHSINLRRLEIWFSRENNDFVKRQKCRALKDMPKRFGNLTSLKRLSMCKCEVFEEFPSGLSNLISLEELNFSECQALKFVPEGFGNLTCLKKLYMWECEALKEFPCGLSNLIALEELYFSNCRALKSVPEGFGNLTRLKKLYMRECEALKEFPCGLNNLIALEELNFSKCRALKSMPEGFGNLTCLKKLYMWECEVLEEFPSGLSNLISLEELDFSNYRALKSVPKGFGNLTCLKKLYMWECEVLEEFPSGLSNLIALEVLNFSKCRALKSVPEGFGNLTCLKKLYMGECEVLEEFPSGLSNLISLEELDFSNCRALKSVPKGFGNLTCLKKLYMWECEVLEEFPSGLSNLIALEVLNFSKCRALKSVPEGFGNLTCLKKLYMWECEALKEFPCGLNNLIALKELNFSKCRALKSVPEGFGNLTCLKKLYMGECEVLEEFPSGLSNLIALEVLNFSKCRALKYMLEGFGNLTCLKRLSLEECEVLEEFPSGLSNLIALEVLNFSKCRALKYMLEGFGNLTCLKRLSLEECEVLEEFPSGLSNLIALEVLNFSKCRALKYMLEGFGNLTCLKELLMRECEVLEEFPSGLSNLISLKELDFSKCRALKYVPEGFGNLTCLKRLSLEECDVLEEFPCGYSNLISLEELDFSKCVALKHVPEGFGDLTCLKKL